MHDDKVFPLPSLCLLLPFSFSFSICPSPNYYFRVFPLTEANGGCSHVEIAGCPLPNGDSPFHSIFPNVKQLISTSPPFPFGGPLRPNTVFSQMAVKSRP